MSQAPYSETNAVIVAEVDLDNHRQRRYIREYTDYTPGGYLPQYKPDHMPGSANDLSDVIRQQRRPSLYTAIKP